MNTKELIQLTQASLTRAMMVRSAPSGGLPIAFRSLLMELGNKTIMTGSPFETHEAADIVGGVISKYYKAGDISLAGDLASMSDEPFPLITPYVKRDRVVQDAGQDMVTSFKNKQSGNSTELRYMMVQFSELGYEYMKNMKYFPKTMNMNNNQETPIHVKSHVPAELFRTTVFRTQGRGADTYPMNPGEIFYTMYEMLDKGYDIPVEELTAFKGFDLGNPHISVYMKPEALYSLFNIGICSFKSRIAYDIDYSTNTLIMRAFPYKMRGVTFDKQIEDVLKKNDYRFSSFTVDSSGISTHIGKNEALKMRGLVFHTRDEHLIRKDIESHFYRQLFKDQYHFAHEVEIGIDNKVETTYSLKSKSVRETLITCIENFKEITSIKYQRQIDDIEEQIKVLRIYEKSTRDYIADHIHRLQRVPGREGELKRLLDSLRAEDPEKYPEFTMEEISSYIYVRNGNNILANLDVRGSEYYKHQIEGELRKIEHLKEKLKPQNIANEAKETYLRLSKNEQFKRKSPIYFVNSAMPIEAKEKMVDYVSTFQKGKVQTKTHYYGGRSILRTSGENLPEIYTPSYTLRERKEYLYQEGGILRSLYGSLVPFLDNPQGYVAGDIRMIQPVGEEGIYLTNLGRVGVADKHNLRGGVDGYPLLTGEFMTDFIPIKEYMKLNVARVGVIIVSKAVVKVLPLEEVINDHRRLGNLTSIAKYDDTTAIEIVEDLNDLSCNYLWNSTTSEFIDISTVNWKSMKVQVGENYYPYSVYSGNKKMYLGGVHVPAEIVSEITGVKLKTGRFIQYMEIPLEFKSYIAYISENREDNSEAEIEDLRTMVSNRLNSLIMEGIVAKKSKTSALATFSFIREI